MDNKTKLLGVLAIIIVVTFYGGVKYSEAKTKTASAAGMAARTQMGFARGARGMGGGFSTGEIIAKDDKSITIKLMAGGSKVVFISSSTPIMKTVSGSASDLASGVNVSVTGNSNSDGSITASSVDLRPSNNK